MDNHGNVATGRHPFDERAYLLGIQKLTLRGRPVSAGIKRNQELRVEAGSVAPVEFPIEHEPFNFPGVGGNRLRLMRPAYSPTRGAPAIAAVSAAESLPVENSRPWSIDNQPLKIQVSTKVMHARPST